MKTKIQVKLRNDTFEIEIDDSCVVNPDDFAGACYSPRAYLLFEECGLNARIVFAGSEDGALETMAENGYLDSFVIEDGDSDYAPEDYENGRLKLYGQINKSKWYDVEGLHIIQVVIPPISFCACYEAMKEDKISGRM